MNDVRIVAAGDSSIVVELEARIDPAVNDRAIAIAAAIEAAHLSGIRDVVTTYRSVAIYFDPLRTDLDALDATVSREAAQLRDVAPVERPIIEVPVCYGGPYGPDLASVATFARLSEEQVIDVHSRPVYRVYMLGFVAGFAYLGRVDPVIAAPRLANPRVRVPAGSVGIAGFQTGVYPMTTPGGWRLIGRTSLKPFDATRPEPFLFQPGDRVKFVPIPAADSVGPGGPPVAATLP